METKGWHVSVNLIFVPSTLLLFQPVQTMLPMPSVNDQANTALVNACKQYCVKVKQRFGGSMERPLQDRCGALVEVYFQPIALHVVFILNMLNRNCKPLGKYSIKKKLKQFSLIIQGRPGHLS